MSHAFVKEPDGDAVADDQPELPISPHPNYVTPQGLAQLKEALAGLLERRRELDDGSLGNKLPLAQAAREIRYFEARLSQAILVEPATQPPGEVAFGAAVTVVDEDGGCVTYRIVGEDEADPGEGKVSWISPLAKALIEARVGDIVIWERPLGETELEIISIAYPTANTSLR